MGVTDRVNKQIKQIENVGYTCTNTDDMYEIIQECIYVGLVIQLVPKGSGKVLIQRG